MIKQLHVRKQCSSSIFNTTENDILLFKVKHLSDVADESEVGFQSEWENEDGIDFKQD